MSKAGSKEAIFQEIALAHFRGREVTIDEIRETCETEGFWTDEELSRAVHDWKNDQVRRLARKPIFDEDGNRREMVNIKREGAQTGERQQFFVFLDEAAQEDLEWVIKDRVKKYDYFAAEIVRLLGVYQERFGKKARTKFQRRLNLNFEAGT